MTESKNFGYKCLNCGKEVDVDISTSKKIICPYCGYRILEKKRPTTVKSILAR